MTQCKRLGCLAIAALLLLPAAGQTRNKAERRSADKHATSQPHESFGRMPAAIDRTVKRQNSPQDMLQVDITHSAASGGKSVSYVRAVWGDLDNQIKGGRQYYSDWDGNLVIDNGAGEVVHKIAFDDRDRATTRPARAAKRAKELTAAEIVRHKAGKLRHFAITAKADRGQPGPGSGRDRLDDAAGAKINWQAGVVGAYDGLLIKITSDKPDVTATLTAGKFTIPIKITGGS